MSISRLMLLSLGAVLVVALVMPAHARQAQLAPTPKSAPRTPVKSRALPAPSMPTARSLSGNATILDTERMRLGGHEIRLFGIVPPKMNSELGPQTRAVLDALAQGTVTCNIKDRKKAGHLLATCTNDSSADFGIELLRRGLAVAARGTLEPTKLAGPYLASEKAAQKQKLGLWQTKIPAAASTASIKKAEAEASAAKQKLARLQAETKEAEARARSLKAEDAEDLEIAPRPQVKPEEPQIAKIENIATTATITLTQEELKPTNIVSLGTATNTTTNQATEESVTDNKSTRTVNTNASWLERNQLFATGILFLLSTLALVGGNFLWRLREKKTELRAMAAALRGELTAARAIGRARLNKWKNMDEMDAAIWPRIRVMVFQAYLSKLGLFGADLSRQLASVYGQASDFASYYNQTKEQGDIVAKTQALQTLLDHIEEIMPQLSTIEETGMQPQAQVKATVKCSLLSHLPKKKMPPTDGGTPSVIAPPEKTKQPSNKASKKKAAEKLAHVKAELTQDYGREKRRERNRPSPLQLQKDKIKEAMSSVRERIDLATKNAARRLAELRSSPTESYIPDYANLTEEELEALSEDSFDDIIENEQIKKAR